MEILVVEDDRDLGQQISAAIANWGYAPFVAASPEQAANQAAAKKFDVVLYDVSGPEPDLETLAALQRTLPGIVVVAMNKGDYYQPRLEARLRERGVRYYTIKPPGGGKLLEEVMDHLLLRLMISSS